MSSASSAAIGGKLARSASSIIASSTSGYHILKIDGYSRTKGTPNAERIKSHPFTLGDYSWYIGYYPNGEGNESSDYISLFLFLDREVPSTVKVQYNFRFLDDDEQAPSWTSRAIYDFRSNFGWGSAKFVQREALEQSEHLRDDSFTVRCDINIINDVRTETLPAQAAAAPTTFVSVPPSDLHHHLGDLLRTGEGADVVFQVAGEAFQAHRCVLASRSPVFKAELLGAMKESRRHDDAVRIEDMEAHVFKALLCFAYTDSLPETSSKEEEAAMSQHLLVAADRYGMERLMRICEDRLCRCIEPNNLATILALAEQHHCHGLKKACFSFLASPVNLTAALASDGFEHLTTTCPSVVKELILMLGT